MKRIYYSLVFTFILFTSSYAQINVPDANFRAVLSSNYGITFDAGNNITNTATAASLTRLNVTLGDPSGPIPAISDLTGIEAFTGLTYLECQNNQLTSIDIASSPMLDYFSVGTTN